jgi:8-oxo-dGTP pyrophosphatase MutT (NUDIX family)
VDVTEAVRAAGGVVTRRSGEGELEVVIVHRVSYGDWTFPKGKLHDGESEDEAAVREVEEETRLRCSLGRELGSTRYHDSRGRPKTVRYWEMSVVDGELEPANEIDAARWSPLEEARSLLTYERDVALLDLLQEPS